MSGIDQFFVQLVENIPEIFISIILLIIALLLAFLIKRLVVRSLRNIGVEDKLVDWGIAEDLNESATYLETIGSIVYFIVLLVFLPFILRGLNIGGVLNPIIITLQESLSYIPNIIMAVLILVIGAYFCNFVRKLSKNVLSGLNIDTWYQKLTKQKTISKDNQLADVIATVIYVLLYIPILIVALETLSIETISNPIINVLNQVLAIIPKVISAIVMLMIGGFIAQLVGGLLEGLISATGVDKYSDYLTIRQGRSSMTISAIISGIVKIILTLFFIVEAINILGLEVLNAIGESIIGYVPFVVSALIILGFILVGGNFLANFTMNATGDKLLGQIIRYIISALGIFMILEQLQIAQTIVNAGFIITLSSIGITLALAFGLGGRDFAKKQYERLDHALTDDDQQKLEDNNNSH